jgi:hypothetical protein
MKPKQLSVCQRGHLLLCLAVALTMVSQAAPQATSPDLRARAKITWSETALGVTASSGNPAVVELSFTSSKKVRNVTMRATPEIERFLSFNPGFRPFIPARQPQPVAVTVQVPEGTAAGEYHGAIYVQRRNRTLADSVSITIRVQPASSNRYTLYSSATDPLLLRAETESGAVIECFGARDAAGYPESLYAMRIAQADGHEANYAFDERTRPTLMQASDGVVLKFEYPAERLIRVTAASPPGPGAFQITLDVDLDSGTVTPTGRAVSLGEFAAQDGRTAATQAVRSTPRRLQSPVAQEVFPCPSPTNPSASAVTVTKCGEPVTDAVVGVKFEGTRIPAQHVGGGVYSVSLPTDRAAEDGERLCRSVLGVLEPVCAFLDAAGATGVPLEALLCEQLALLSPVLGGGCAIILGGLNIYCGTVGTELGTNIVCGAVREVVNRGVGGLPVTLQPIVDRGDITVEGETVSAPGTGPFPCFGIEIPCQRNLLAVLTWDTNGTDVDLHVRDSLGREAYYGDKTAIPNGLLDVDDVDGFGPETFTLSEFEEGVSYAVFVHYYSDHGFGPTTAHVKVFLDGELVTDFSGVLANGQVADVGTYPVPPAAGTPARAKIPARSAKAW